MEFKSKHGKNWSPNVPAQSQIRSLGQSWLRLFRRGRTASSSAPATWTEGPASGGRQWPAYTVFRFHTSLLGQGFRNIATPILILLWHGLNFMSLFKFLIFRSLSCLSCAVIRLESVSTGPVRYYFLACSWTYCSNFLYTVPKCGVTRLLEQDFFLKYLFYLIHPFFSACCTNCNGTARVLILTFFHTVLTNVPQRSKLRRPMLGSWSTALCTECAARRS